MALPALLGIPLAAITAPGTIELAVLSAAALLPRRKRRDPSLGCRRLAVVVPAHDEARGITRCIRSLQRCDPPGCSVELVVVADNCSDDTAERARAAGARVLERVDPERRGKGYALEHAFRHLLEERADLDAVLVVDADTDVAPTFLSACARRFAEGADGVQCRYLVRDPGESRRKRLMNVAFMAFNVLRPRGRDRLGLSAGILGNGFGLSRHCLESVPYAARSVVEDLEHHLDLVRAGYRIEFVDETCVRGDMPEAGPGVETQRARWEGGRLRMIREKGPALLGQIACGHLRLAEPLLELALLPLATHVGLLGVTLLVPYPPTQALALAGLGVVAAHVGIALLVGGADRADLAALASAPLYVAWKARLLPRILGAARREQEWVRTERAEPEAPRSLPAHP